MFWPIFLIVTCVKILFIPSYRQQSPITSKSLKEMRWHLLSGRLTSRFTATGWPSPTARSCRAGIGRSPACRPGHSTTLLTLLTLNTSCLLLQGNLKIVSEWTLTICLSFIDPGMLDVRNLNFASESTILFQRLTVITTDLVFALGAKQCSEVNITYHFPIRMFLMFSLPILGTVKEAAPEATDASAPDLQCWPLHCRPHSLPGIQYQYLRSSGQNLLWVGGPMWAPDTFRTD